MRGLRWRERERERQVLLGHIFCLSVLLLLICNCCIHSITSTTTVHDLLHPDVAGKSLWFG